MQFRKTLGNWRVLIEGDRIAVLAFDDRIELRPLKHMDERMFTSHASEKSLSKDWNSKEDDLVWKDLRAETDYVFAGMSKYYPQQNVYRLRDEFEVFTYRLFIFSRSLTYFRDVIQRALSK